MILGVLMKVFLLLVALVPTAARAELLLYSDDNTFHGCLDCGKYDNESVCNKYGTYGSKYNSDSIWSKYGIGSKYDNDSPFSKYGNGLKVVDRNGGFYGYFSRSYNGETEFRRLLNNLWEIADGDYEQMRDIFCE